MTERSLVVAQSGGATAVINATLFGVVSAGMAPSSVFSKVIGVRHGLDGLIAGDLLDFQTVSPETLVAIRTTPSAALGTTRRKASPADLDLAIDRMTALNAVGMVFIGGNDSADTANRLHLRARERKLDLCFLLAPKTVDNDLPETDFSPGFPSIARYLGNTVRDATYDVIASPSLAPIRVVEVMGRDAGWVAASCSAAFQPDEQDLLPLLYLPERPPESLDQVVAELADHVTQRGWVVAVIPETLRASQGEHLSGGSAAYIDPFGHPYYPSAAGVVSQAATEKLGIRARFDRPGTASRMSIALASPVDLDYAERAGQEAAALIEQGVSNQMVRFVRTAVAPYVAQLQTVPLGAIANRHRPLPDHFIDRSGRGVTPTFQDYLQPLLGDFPFPHYQRLPGDRYSIHPE